MWGTMYYLFQHHPHKLTFFWEETTQKHLDVDPSTMAFVGPAYQREPLSRKLLARAPRFLRFFFGVRRQVRRFRKGTILFGCDHFSHWKDGSLFHLGPQFSQFGSISFNPWPFWFPKWAVINTLVIYVVYRGWRFLPRVYGDYFISHEIRIRSWTHQNNEMSWSGFRCCCFCCCRSCFFGPEKVT